MKKILKYFMGLSLALWINCNNESFTPYAEIENKLISYSVLDSRIDTQFVKVQSVYLENQNEQSIKNLRVYLSEENGGTFNFIESFEINKNRYANFYLPGFRPKRGRNYTLTVLSDSFSQYSEIFIPKETTVGINMRMDTGVGGDGDRVNFTFNVNVPSSAPKANVLKFFIEYEKVINGKVVKEFIQMPVGGSRFNSSSSWWLTEYWNFWIRYTDLFFSEGEIVYPEPSNDWTKAYYTCISDYHRVNIPFACIIYALDQIGQRCDPKDVTITGAFAVFYSIDNYYYENFYSIKNEEYSVRVDNPYYASNFKNNIEGDPIGLFTWVTTDTTRFNIIHEPISILKFNDGQKKKK